MKKKTLALLLQLEIKTYFDKKLQIKNKCQLTSFRNDRVCIPDVYATVLHIRFEAVKEKNKNEQTRVFQEKAKITTLQYSPWL